jgi:hypothetical protein
VELAVVGRVAAGREGRDGYSLAPWVCLPILGAAFIFAAVFALPSIDCEGGGDAGASAGRAIFLTCAAAASLVVGGAAVYRFWELYRGGHFQALRDGALLLGAGVLLLIVFANPLIVGRGERTFAPQVFVGIFGTIASLLYLLAAWARGLSVNDVGAVVPLYLAFALIFFYLPFVGFAWGANHGAFC